MRTVRTTIAAVVAAGEPDRVRLDTGEIRALPRGTEVPFLSLPEVGGFALPSDGGERRYVFHPRA